MVVNVLRYLAETVGIVPVQIDIPFPVHSAQDFLAPVEAALKIHGSELKLACIDHISGYPTCVLPIKELLALCHQYSVPVLVDGAHALGNIPIDIGDMNPDFYISNGHKWLYSPKGSAILFVATQYQKWIVPAVLSSEFQGANFASSFQYTGTRNYNAMLAMSAALEFRRGFGENAVMTYTRELAWEGANRWKAMWNTELLAPQEMNSAIVNVRLPTDNMTLVDQVRDVMMSRYDTYIQTAQFQGRAWIRLSGQIYLQMDDIVLAGQRILSLCQELSRGNQISLE